MSDVIEDEIDSPQVLYRYQSFDTNGNNLRSLQVPSLWFSSAQRFNDPFDSALTFNVDVIDPDLRLEWATRVVQREYQGLSRGESQRRAQALLQQLDDDPALVGERQEASIQLNYEKFGICCLTSVKDDILMWSHYADGHAGFALGIDVATIRVLQDYLAHQKLLLDLQPIVYAKSKPQINFYESMMSSNSDQDIIRLLMTKSDQWSYEHEYRLVSWERVDFGLAIPEDCISEIILGCRTRADDEARLRAALEVRGLSPKIFRAREHEIDFSLVIDEVDEALVRD